MPVLVMWDEERAKYAYIECDEPREDMLEFLRKYYGTYRKVKSLFRHGRLKALGQNLDLCVFYGRDLKSVHSDIQFEDQINDIVPKYSGHGTVPLQTDILLFELKKWVLFRQAENRGKHE